MKAERWHRLDEVVAGALDLPEEGRAAFLDEACGSAGELRRRAEKPLDGGATEDGRPYLVMEQVDGVPLKSDGRTPWMPCPTIKRF